MAQYGNTKFWYDSKLLLSTLEESLEKIYFLTFLEKVGNVLSSSKYLKVFLHYYYWLFPLTKEYKI